MSNQFNKTDYILWSAIAAYTGIIYTTLSIVSAVRKSLAEKYGPDVFDFIYWILGIIILGIFFFCFRKFQGRQLAHKLAITAVFTGIYVYLMMGMKYPVERIHFLEYGLLGVLVYFACTRHIRHITAIILSLNIVYWIGLGDEAIQGILASRVGEIRDCVINLFSGALGIGFIWFIIKNRHTENRFTIFFRKTIIIAFFISTLFTALFIYYIHGFGHSIDIRDIGRTYSSFSQQQLSRINRGLDQIPLREITLYEDEALRHLFQRDYYLTHDFRAQKGSLYKNYHNCFYENRILEVFYSRFLEEHADQNSGPLLKPIDRAYAKRLMHNPVLWPDSVRTLVEKSFKKGSWFFQSRVKSRVITSYTLKDLLFYCALLLFVLGTAWVRLPKKDN